jgi:hypothetical protein
MCPSAGSRVSRRRQVEGREPSFRQSSPVSRSVCPIHHPPSACAPRATSGRCDALNGCGRPGCPAGGRVGREQLRAAAASRPPHGHRPSQRRRASTCRQRTPHGNGPTYGTAASGRDLQRFASTRPREWREPAGFARRFLGLRLAGGGATQSLGTRPCGRSRRSAVSLKRRPVPRGSNQLKGST